MYDADSSAPVREGEIIAGKYKVERVLGVGGMGVVVAAMHLELDQRIALKFLLPPGATQQEVALRFAREARAAAKIRSEHVARVIDVGTLPSGAPYMVMEYMDGEDLDKVLERHGPMPFDLATSYVLQASEAIAEAHALGIVHRDLKPANLFLASQPGSDPIVKVLDFGISKQTLGTSEAHLTKTSAVMGSPLYMSPEQIASAKTVDTRSDIWALGVVLYELLANALPFPAESMPELIAAVLQRQPIPVRTMRPDVPPELDAVILRCLEKEPARRYQNIAELATALVPFGKPDSAASAQRIGRVLKVTGGDQTIRTGAPAMPGSPMVGMPPYATTGMPHQAGATNAQWSQSQTGVTPKKSSTGLIAGGVAAVLAIGIGFAVFHARSAPTAPIIAAASSPSTSAPPVAQPPPPASTPAPASAAADSPPSPSAIASTAAAPPSDTPAGSPQSTAATPPQAAHTPGKPAAHAAATAAPAKPASSGPVCSVVTFIDADGNKRFTRECK